MVVASKRKTRRVALRSVDRPKPPAREKPIPNIIEVFADGWIQIFGPRHVRPVVFDGLIAARPEEADVVDMFHEHEVPRVHREFYFPKFLLKTHLVEKRTLEKEVRRREWLAMLRDFQGLAETCKEGGRRE